MEKLATMYAQALFDLAQEEALQQRFLEELTAVRDAFEAQPDYLRLLATPGLPKDERCGLLQESIGGSVHGYVLNFAKLLVEKNHIRQFADCVKAYEKLYNEANGILPVQAVTAVALTDAQREKLAEKLAKLTGKTIRLHNRIDPECLGGVRLLYDGKLVEGTVAGSLETLRKNLAGTVL